MLEEIYYSQQFLIALAPDLAVLGCYIFSNKGSIQGSD